MQENGATALSWDIPLVNASSTSPAVEKTEGKGPGEDVEETEMRQTGWWTCKPSREGFGSQ